MKKLLLTACAAIFLSSCQNHAQNVASVNYQTQEIAQQEKINTMAKENIYQFKVEDLNGKTFDFATLKGKKIMVVNTASNCGYTKQYKDLELLYKTYKEQNFVVVGFPANNFGGQEPGTNEEIGAFCQQNYGVTFPMMGKISVKGSDMNAIYQFLTQKSKNGLEDSEVQWNFQKYLINENGELERVLLSKVVPTDPSIVAWIKG